MKHTRSLQIVGILSLIFSFGVIPAAAQESLFSFGVNAGFSVTAFGFPDVETETTAYIEPLVSAGFGNVFITGKMKIAVPASEFEIDPDALLSELRIEWYPASVFSIIAGYFVHVPGNYEFISPLNFLNPTNFDGMESGLDASTKAVLPQTMIQGRLFLGPVFLRGTIRPVPSAGYLPTVAGRFFPGALVPDFISADQSILIPDSGSTRRNIYIDYPSREPVMWDDAAALMELGISLGPVDVNVLYYYGDDPSVALDYHVAFANSSEPNGLFDLTIQPRPEAISAYGLDFATSIGAFRLYGSGVFVYDRLVSGSLETLETAGTSTSSQHRSTLDAAAGVSWDYYTTPLPWIGPIQIIALSEYRRLVIAGSDDEVQAPFFSHVVAGRLALALPDVETSIGCTTLVSLPAAGLEEQTDTSAVVAVDVTKNIRGASVMMRLPLFYGPADSLFGQFQDREFVSLGIVWQI